MSMSSKKIVPLTCFQDLDIFLSRENEKKINFRELSERSGVARTMLYKIFRKKDRDVRGNTLIKLCNGLGYRLCIDLQPQPAWSLP